MSRKAKGARLYLRQDCEPKVWIIRDGTKTVRTGHVESEIEQAQLKLAAYINKTHNPVKIDAVAEELSIAAVLMVYLDHKHPPETRPVEHKDKPARLREFEGIIGRLNDFWGDLTVDQILGPKCREFAKGRGTDSGARKDLEILRAAVRHYKAEHGLKGEPVFTLPKKQKSRERWLSRDEAARLIWACYRDKTETNAGKRKHLVRFIILAIYTATRHNAILSLQWRPNDDGGHVDLPHGVLYRKSAKQEQTKKRRPPIRIPQRVMAHLERWHRLDKGITHVCHYYGKPISRLEKSFRNAREAAKLDDEVIPHALRHTAITWLMQAGTPVNEVSGFAGVTVEELERTYSHHHPDYQSTVVTNRLTGPARKKAA
ncbi:site-specific integrase [Aureimonas altamirensis]|uniref:site-specific integrase n=1 Tax=Aureimonas altamirensis TaxID=370622 RepID=UPI003019291D